MSIALFGRGLLYLDISPTKEISPVLNLNLKSPDGNNKQLFQGKFVNYVDTIEDCFLEAGVYSLSIDYILDNGIKDTLVHDFSINGQEQFVNINISMFYFKSVKCNINIEKHFKSHDSIKIYPARVKSHDEYYKGPFFRIENLSKDTLYGKYLDGYFWGDLSILSSDGTWKNLPSNLDMNFVYLSGLNPDSSTIATVGSFGLNSIMPQGRYMYKLAYKTHPSDKNTSKGFWESEIYWLIRDFDYYWISCGYESNIK
jgi:hypothetical protein